MNYPKCERNPKQRLSEDPRSLNVSGKLPTYPSPKPTLALPSHLGQRGRWAVS